MFIIYVWIYDLYFQLFLSNFIFVLSKISIILRFLIDEFNSQVNISLIIQILRRVFFFESVEDRLKMFSRVFIMFIDQVKNIVDEDMKTENGSYVGSFEEEFGNEVDVDIYGDFMLLFSNLRLFNYNFFMFREYFQRDFFRIMAEYLVQAVLLVGVKDNVIVMIILLSGCGVQFIDIKEDKFFYKCFFIKIVIKYVIIINRLDFYFNCFKIVMCINI